MNNGVVLNDGSGSLRRHYVPNSSVVVRGSPRDPHGAGPRPKPERRSAGPRYLSGTASSSRRSNFMPSPQAPSSRNLANVPDAREYYARDDDELSVASTASSVRVFRSANERYLREVPAEETRERGRIEALEDYTFIMLMEDFHEGFALCMHSKKLVTNPIPSSNPISPSSSLSSLSAESPDFQSGATTPASKPQVEEQSVSTIGPTPSAPPELSAAAPSSEPDARPDKEVAAEHHDHSNALPILNEALEAAKRAAFTSSLELLSHEERVARLSVEEEEKTQRSALPSPPQLPQSVSDRSVSELEKSIFLEQQMRELVDDNKKLMGSLALAQREIARLSATSQGATQTQPPVHPALRVHTEIASLTTQPQQRTTLLSAVWNAATSTFVCCRRPPETSQPNAATPATQTPAPSAPQKL